MARGTLHARDPHSRRGRREGLAASPGGTVVVDDGQRRGPELKGEFRPEVHQWYDAWRRSPQAQMFVSTDWARLHVLAHLLNRYLVRPSAMAMAEIRMSEERLGATIVDRLRARITVAEEAPVAPVEEIPASLRRREV